MRARRWERAEGQIDAKKKQAGGEMKEERNERGVKRERNETAERRRGLGEELD